MWLVTITPSAGRWLTIAVERLRPKAGRSRAAEVAVIGAGHNGLVCACYLARAGLDVTVLERREVVGGACVTEELFPGYRCSTASLVTSLFRPEIVADLDLASHGLEFIPRNPSVVALFPDERHLMLGSDEGECVRQIAQFSRADAESYPVYGRTMRRLASFVEPYLMNPLPALDGDAGTAAKAMLRQALELLGGSAAGFLERWFESDAIKAPLVIDGITGVDASPSMPGSAYLMLYHMTGGTEVGRPAWGQVRGGMGGITSALASAASSHGATIRTGSPVARILAGDGRAEGVVLEPGDLPRHFRHAIENRRFDGVAMKMHLALDRLPRVQGFHGDGDGDGAGP